MLAKISFDDLQGKVCVLTGGAGVIGASLVRGLAAAGVKTAIVDLNEEAATKLAAEVVKEFGTVTIGVGASVLDKDSLIAAKKVINEKLGKINFLINGAGGNSPAATTQLEEITPGNLNELDKTFYGLNIEGFQKVYDLNFKGTLLPTMVFTTDMLDSGKGGVLNISSMNAYKPLTKIPAYSAAKASINNFTEWLAVHLAKTGIRVNAIAPGFFLTNQNRFLLTDEKTGEATARGKKIIGSTPMGKYGEPDDLKGAMLFLLSDVSSFITGICIPVDGGYSAYGGV
ncbi:MAG: SDR family oxidoreductase [Bacteroidales bacterium]|jgi:NAD(P)-dependent dehydrogenase (short-subunit alcohol dehydrogenase family)|nr:SDR family oxidoreductase [Bacteroidales bacterium]